MELLWRSIWENPENTVRATLWIVGIAWLALVCLIAKGKKEKKDE